MNNLNSKRKRVKRKYFIIITIALICEVLDFFSTKYIIGDNSLNYDASVSPFVENNIFASYFKLSFPVLIIFGALSYFLYSALFTYHTFYYPKNNNPKLISKTLNVVGYAAIRSVIIAKVFAIINNFIVARFKNISEFTYSIQSNSWVADLTKVDRNSWINNITIKYIDFNPEYLSFIWNYKFDIIQVIVFLICSYVIYSRDKRNRNLILIDNTMKRI